MPDFFAYDQGRGVVPEVLRFSFSLLGAVNGALAAGTTYFDPLRLRGAGMWIGNERDDEPFPVLLADPGLIDGGPPVDSDSWPIAAGEFEGLSALLNDLVVYRPADLRVSPLGRVDAHAGPGDPVTGTGTGRLGVCFDVGGQLHVSTAGHCLGPRGTGVSIQGTPGAMVVDRWNPLTGILPHPGGCMRSADFLDVGLVDPGVGYTQPTPRFGFGVSSKGPDPGEPIQRFDFALVGTAHPINTLAHWVLVSYPAAGLWSCCYMTRGAIGTSGDSGSPVVWDDNGTRHLVGHYLGGDANSTRSFVQGIDYQLHELATRTSQSVTVAP
jgi:hypothetical protein